MGMNTDPILEFSQSYPSPASRYIMEREIRQANGWLAVNKWKPTDGMAYLRGLEEKGLSPSSIKTKCLRVAKFFSWMIESGYYKGPNPIPIKSLPKFRDARCPQALTKSEATKLMKQPAAVHWIGCRDRFALSLMLIHGIRIGSVSKLCWSDVERQGNSWIIKTKNKGNVYSSKVLRPDVADLMKKYYLKTYHTELK